MTASLESSVPFASVPRRTTSGSRAHIIVTNEHGAVEVAMGGLCFVGIIEARGSLVAVADSLWLRLLCRLDEQAAVALDPPVDLTARVTAIDENELVGSSQLLTAGVGFEVDAVEALPTPALRTGSIPVVLGTSVAGRCDEALAATSPPLEIDIEEIPVDVDDEVFTRRRSD